MSERTIHIPEEGYVNGDLYADEFYYWSNGAFVRRPKDHGADAILDGSIIAEIKVELGYEETNFNSRIKKLYSVLLHTVSDIYVVFTKLWLKCSGNLYIEWCTGKNEQLMLAAACSKDAPIPSGYTEGGPWKALKDKCNVLIHVFPLSIGPGGKYYICTDIPRLIEWLEAQKKAGKLGHPCSIKNKGKNGVYFSVGWPVNRAELLRLGLFKEAYLPE